MTNPSNLSLYIESSGGGVFLSWEALIDYLILSFPLLFIPSVPVTSWAIPSFLTAGDAISYSLSTLVSALL